MKFIEDDAALAKSARILPLVYALILVFSLGALMAVSSGDYKQAFCFIVTPIIFCPHISRVRAAVRREREKENLTGASSESEDAK